MSPFEGLSQSQQHKLFKLLQVHIYTYSKQQEILPTIKSENIIGVILSGYAQIINIDYNGNEIIIEHLEKDDVFGTNINNINNESVQLVAKEDTKVLVINYSALVNSNYLNYTYYNTFIQNLFNIINLKYKETNERVKILENKTIRDKLLEYFETNYKKTLLRTITLPFNLKDLADYIAVNRSAMFRELKNLKEERFIEIKGKKITLLYK